MPDPVKFDLDRRLHGVDSARMPDLWPAAIDRAATDGPGTVYLEPPGTRRFFVAGIALAVAAITTGVLVWAFRGTSPPLPAGPVRNGAIVAVRTAPSSLLGVDNTELVAVDPATGDSLDVTDSPDAEQQPVWSPNGTRVAFVRTSSRPGGGIVSALFAMNSNGTGLSQIAMCPLVQCSILSMAWSPDDVHLAVATDPRDSPIDSPVLRIVDTRTGGSTVVCANSTCNQDLETIAWSPDGRRIAFAGFASTRLYSGFSWPRGSVWVVGARGGQPQQLTDPCRPGEDPCSGDQWPTWSPDGRTIAFIRTPRPGIPNPHGPQVNRHAQLVLMSPSGTIQSVVSICRDRNPCEPAAPSWSADGRSILTAVGYQPRSIVLVDRSNGRVKSLTSPPSGACSTGSEAPPTWSPDHRSVAFLGGPGGANLCVVPVTGGLARVMVGAFRPNPSVNWDYHWLPASALQVPAGSRAPTIEPVPMERPPLGTIVFASSNASRNTDVWSVSSTDPSPQRLTSAGSATWPDVSPDGMRIVFERTGGPGTLWIINADGSGLRRLGAGEHPAWSPDGRSIAYAAFPSSAGPHGIYVMDADGKNSHLVATGIVTDPAWTPDGTRITYAIGNGTGGEHLETVDLATGSVTRLPALTGAQWGPAWSPDGSTLAFRWSTGVGQAIYLMDEDGSNLRRLTDFQGWSGSEGDGEGGEAISWSPDGRWLAFDGSDGTTGPQIYVIRPDATGLSRVTDMRLGPHARTLDPSWTPSTR